MDVDPILRRSHNDTVRALVRALDLHEPGEAGHAERVAVYAVATGARMGMSDGELVDLRRASALHDVGKISLDAELLNKIDELEPADLDELRLHATLAMETIESLDFLANAVPMVKHHHERWDGSGYPDGLSGESIPLGARLIAVAEAFDTLVESRGWRPGLSEGDALDEIRASGGTHFDPKVVEAFAQIQPLIQPIEASN